MAHCRFSQIWLSDGTTPTEVICVGARCGKPYEVVLIVCEGTKTEPYYLDGVHLAYRLSNANIRVMPADGSDPMSVVRVAEEHMRLFEYDRGFCVFDRNGHANFEAALNKLRDSVLGRAGRLQAITSVPCFEIWVLLHFAYTTAPFRAARGESACDRVVGAVRKHLPNYRKGAKEIFGQVAPLIQQALIHATRLAEHNRGSNTSNPATDMHLIVRYLQMLKHDGNEAQP
jgi:RloB-like protein